MSGYISPPSSLSFLAKTLLFQLRLLVLNPKPCHYNSTHHWVSQTRSSRPQGLQIKVFAQARLWFKWSTKHQALNQLCCIRAKTKMCMVAWLQRRGTQMPHVCAWMCVRAYTNVSMCVGRCSWKRTHTRPQNFTLKEKSRNIWKCQWLMSRYKAMSLKPHPLMGTHTVHMAQHVAQITFS